MIEALESRLHRTAATHVAAVLPHYDHIVVVVEENHSYEQVLGYSQYPPFAFPFFMWPTVLSVPLIEETDPYIRSLTKHSAVFTNSHGISHPSEPNYLALFSGSNQGTSSDATPPKPLAAPSLGGELIAKGLSFGGYAENLPHTGYAGPDARYYVKHHNPWVQFADVPAQDNLPFALFNRNFALLPTVSFVVPNIVNDMHSETIRRADQWLHDNLGAYIRWAPTHDSLLILTWDEDNGSGSNHIATLFFGAHVRAGHYSEPLSHYRVLRTMQEMYGLAPTGLSGRVSPITDVFV